jgi:hypothetical protein
MLQKNLTGCGLLVVFCLVAPMIFANESTSATPLNGLNNLEPSVHKISLEKGKEAFFNGNFERAMQVLGPLADFGSAEAQYYFALSVKSAPKTANKYELWVPFVQKSAAQEYGPAMTELGQIFESGLGVEADLLVALDWYRKSESVSEMSATTIKYYVEKNGRLVEQEFSAFFADLEERAGRGERDAQVALAKMYDAGVLVENNIKQTFFWYKKAAETGDDTGALMLGYLYCRGLGVEKNSELANYWINKSKRNARCQ